MFPVHGHREGNKMRKHWSLRAILKMKRIVLFVGRHQKIRHFNRMYTLFLRSVYQNVLQQVMNSGKFPLLSTLWSECPKGRGTTLRKNRWESAVVSRETWHYRQGIQFMFMRKQEELQELFFACPAKCGNYLVDIDPTYVLRKNKVVARVERCPCGQGVCVQCHALVKDKDFEKHTCPDQNKAQQDDLATIALMKKLGKKCPHCNMFIMKNAGCDGKCTQMHLSMVLSNKALHRAKMINNFTKWSICCNIGDQFNSYDVRRQSSWRFTKGHSKWWIWLTFLWVRCVPRRQYNKFEWQRVRCNPVKYKNEIAAYKRKMGIALSTKQTCRFGSARKNSNKLKKGRRVMGRELFMALWQWSVVFATLLSEYEEDPRKRKNVDVDFQMTNGAYAFQDCLYGPCHVYNRTIAICHRKLKLNFMTLKFILFIFFANYSIFLGVKFIYVDQVFPFARSIIYFIFWINDFCLAVKTNTIPPNARHI